MKIQEYSMKKSRIIQKYQGKSWTIPENTSTYFLSEYASGILTVCFVAATNPVMPALTGNRPSLVEKSSFPFPFSKSISRLSRSKTRENVP